MKKLTQFFSKLAAVLCLLFGVAGTNLYAQNTYERVTDLNSLGDQEQCLLVHRNEWGTSYAAGNIGNTTLAAVVVTLSDNDQIITAVGTSGKPYEYTIKRNGSQFYVGMLDEENDLQNYKLTGSSWSGSYNTGAAFLWTITVSYFSSVLQNNGYYVIFNSSSQKFDQSSEEGEAVWIYKKISSGSSQTSCDAATGLTASNTAGGVSFTWAAPSTRPDSYRLKISNSEMGLAYVDGDIVDGSATSYTATKWNTNNFTSGTRYYYTLTSVCGSTETATAVQNFTYTAASSSCAAPSGLSASNTGTGIKFTWTAPSSQPDNYILKIAGNSSALQYMSGDEISGSATTYTATTWNENTFENGTTYYYTLTAVCGSEQKTTTAQSITFSNSSTPPAGGNTYTEITSLDQLQSGSYIIVSAQYPAKAISNQTTTGSPFFFGEANITINADNKIITEVNTTGKPREFTLDVTYTGGTSASASIHSEEEGGYYLSNSSVIGDINGSAVRKFGQQTSDNKAWAVTYYTGTGSYISGFKLKDILNSKYINFYNNSTTDDKWGLASSSANANSLRLFKKEGGSVTPPPTPTCPDAPTGLTTNTTNTASTTYFNWTVPSPAPSGVDYKYTIKYWKAETQTEANASTKNTDQNSDIRLTSLEEFTEYAWKVYSNCADGTPNAATGTNFTTGGSCSTPSTLQADVNGSQVVLSWQNTMTPNKGYIVKYQKDGGSWTTVPDASISGQAATVSGLAAGDYTWTVQSKCSNKHTGTAATGSFTIESSGSTDPEPGAEAVYVKVTDCDDISAGTYIIVTAYADDNDGYVAVGAPAADGSYFNSVAGVNVVPAEGGTYKITTTTNTAGKPYEFEISGTSSNFTLKGVTTNKYYGPSNNGNTALNYLPLASSTSGINLKATCPGSYIDIGVANETHYWYLRYDNTDTKQFMSADMTGMYTALYKKQSGGVTPPPTPVCAKPTNLSTGTITGSSAVISWQITDNPDSYTIKYWKVTESESQATTVTVANGSAHSTTLYGLTASTQYNYKIITNCAGATSQEETGGFTTGEASSGGGDGNTYDLVTNVNQLNNGCTVLLVCSEQGIAAGSNTTGTTSCRINSVNGFSISGTSITTEVNSGNYPYEFNLLFQGNLWILKNTAGKYICHLSTNGDGTFFLYSSEESAYQYGFTLNIASNGNATFTAQRSTSRSIKFSSATAANEYNRNTFGPTSEASGTYNVQLYKKRPTGDETPCYAPTNLSHSFSVQNSDVKIKFQWSIQGKPANGYTIVCWNPTKPTQRKEISIPASYTDNFYEISAADNNMTTGQTYAWKLIAKCDDGQEEAQCSSTFTIPDITASVNSVTPNAINETLTLNQAYTQTIVVTGENLSSVTTAVYSDNNGQYPANKTQITVRDQSATGFLIDVAYTATTYENVDEYIVIKSESDVVNSIHVQFAVPKPTIGKVSFNKESGRYTEGFSLTMSVAQEYSTGTEIRYTTDGTLPTATTGTKYTAPITLAKNNDANYTFTALAFNNNYTTPESNAVTVKYRIADPLTAYSFELVENETGLVNGDYYIMVGEGGDYTVAMARRQEENDQISGTSVRTSYPVSINSKVISTEIAESRLDDEPVALKLVIADDSYKFYSDIWNGYLARYQNKFGMVTDNDEISKWSIQIETGTNNAVITSNSDDRYAIRVQDSAGHNFLPSISTNANRAVKLYHRIDAPSIALNPVYTVPDVYYGSKTFESFDITVTGRNFRDVASSTANFAATITANSRNAFMVMAGGNTTVNINTDGSFSQTVTVAYIPQSAGGVDTASIQVVVNGVVANTQIAGRTLVCSTPQNIDCGTPKQHYAYINFDGTATGTYEYQLTTEEDGWGDPDEDTPIRNTGNASNFAIHNLESNTQYYIRLRKVCNEDANAYSAWATASFKTKAHDMRSVTILSPTNEVVADGGSVGFTFEAQNVILGTVPDDEHDAAVIEIKVDGTVVRTDLTDIGTASNPKPVTINLGEPGEHTVTVTLVDPSTHVALPDEDATETRTYYVINPAWNFDNVTLNYGNPVTAYPYSENLTLYINDAAEPLTVTLSGTDKNYFTIEGLTAGKISPDNLFGEGSVTLPVKYEAPKYGTHTVSVTVANQYVNEQNGFTITATTAPTITVSRPDNNATIARNTGQVTVDYTVKKADIAGGDKVKLVLKGSGTAASVNRTEYSTSATTYTFTELPYGTYDLSISVVKADNSDAVSGQTPVTRRFVLEKPVVKTPIFASDPGTYGDKVRISVRCADPDENATISIRRRQKTVLDADDAEPLAWGNWSEWQPFTAAFDVPNNTPQTVVYQYEAKAEMTGKETSYSVRTIIYRIIKVTYPNLTELTRDVMYADNYEDIDYIVSGEVWVTATDSTNYRVWVQDGVKGNGESILIRNVDPVRFRSLSEGAVLRNIKGKISNENHIEQMYATDIPAPHALNHPLYIDTLTIAQLKQNRRNWQSALVCITPVYFYELAAGQNNFVSGTRYTLRSGVSAQTLPFGTMNRLGGTLIERDTVSITGVVLIEWSNESGVARIAARKPSDIQRIPRPVLDAGANVRLNAIYSGNSKATVNVRYKDITGGKITLTLPKNTRSSFAVTAPSGQQLQAEFSKNIAIEPVTVTYTHQAEAGADTAMLVLTAQNISDTVYIFARSRECAAPLAEEISVSPTGTTANVVISPKDPEDNFEYICAWTTTESQLDDVVGLPPTHIPGHNIEIPGLQYSTTYYYRVRRVCGTDTSQMYTGSFKTSEENAPTLDMVRPVASPTPTVKDSVIVKFEIANFTLGTDGMIKVTFTDLATNAVVRTDYITVIEKKYFFRNGTYNVQGELVDMSQQSFTDGNVADLTTAVRRFNVMLDKTPQPSFIINNELITNPYHQSVTVSMRCSDAPGARLMYSSDSGRTYQLYTAPFTLERNRRLLGRALAAGKDTSTVRDRAVLFTPNAPEITPAGTEENPYDVYEATLVVTVTCNTPGAVMLYTTDGSVPAPDDEETTFPVPADGKITLSSSTTLIVSAFKEGWNRSVAVTSEYKFRTARPLLSVDRTPAKDGSYTDVIKVTATAPTAGSVLRYTRNGQKPTTSSPQFPAAGLTIDSTTNLTVIAFKTGWEPSEPYQRVYKLKVATPVILPEQDFFTGSFQYSVECATEGAEIYVSVNKPEAPDKENANRYTGPRTASGNGEHKIQVIAYKDLLEPSVIAVKTFVINSSINPALFITDKYVEWEGVHTGTRQGELTVSGMDIQSDLSVRAVGNGRGAFTLNTTALSADLVNGKGDKIEAVYTAQDAEGVDTLTLEIKSAASAVCDTVYIICTTLPAPPASLTFRRTANAGSIEEGTADVSVNVKGQNLKNFVQFNVIRNDRDAFELTSPKNLVFPANGEINVNVEVTYTAQQTPGTDQCWIRIYNIPDNVCDTLKITAQTVEKPVVPVPALIFDKLVDWGEIEVSDEEEDPMIVVIKGENLTEKVTIRLARNDRDAFWLNTTNPTLSADALNSAKGVMLGVGYYTQNEDGEDICLLEFKSREVCDTMEIRATTVGNRKVLEKVSKPVITPNGGNYKDSKEVDIICADDEATVYYSTGSEFAEYKGKFTVKESCTVRAYAAKEGALNSDTVSAAFVIVAGTPNPPTPPAPEDSLATEDEILAAVNVYPNPTTGMFKLSVPVAAQVDIYNAAGVILKSERVAEGIRTYRVDASGIYFVRVSLSNRAVIRRVIVR